MYFTFTFSGLHFRVHNAFMKCAAFLLDSFYIRLMETSNACMTAVAILERLLMSEYCTDQVLTTCSPCICLDSVATAIFLVRLQRDVIDMHLLLSSPNLFSSICHHITTRKLLSGFL